MGCFDNINENLDGQILKTDNWQGLNTLKSKYKDSIDLIYIDPPFNTGSDFEYKDKYQDSTWLSIMSDRINLSKILMSKESSFYLHLDYRANYLGRSLLENTFTGNFINEIIWCYTGPTNQKNNFPHKHDTIYLYSKTKDYIFNGDNARVSYKKSTKSGGKTALTGRKDDAILEAIDAKGKIVEDFWTDIADIGKVHNEDTRFKTQKTEKLLERMISVSTDISGRPLILDFFSGSATTICTAHKLGKKWIGMEMGNHFYEKNIPRLKWTLVGNQIGISKNCNYKGGGFFKYYELEQYEDVLAKSQYQWQGKKVENQVEQYSFLQDQKLLDAIEIDYEKKNAKVVFEKLYPDVDIAETLSNLSGKHIKQLFEDKVVFEDGSEVIYDKMTFEKYPWIKPLIWWNSK